MAAGAAVAGLSDFPKFADSRESVDADGGDDFMLGDVQATTDEALAAAANGGARTTGAGAGVFLNFFEQFELGHPNP